MGGKGVSVGNGVAVCVAVGGTLVGVLVGVAVVVSVGGISRTSAVAVSVGGRGVSVGGTDVGVAGTGLGVGGIGLGVGGSGVDVGTSPRGIIPTSSIQNCSSIWKKTSGTKENSSRRFRHVSSMRTKTVMVEFWATAETWNSGQILNSQLSKVRHRSWLHTTAGDAGSVPPVGSIPTRRPTVLSNLPAGS